MSIPYQYGIILMQSFKSRKYLLNHMVIHAKICKTFQVIDRKPLVFIMYEIGSMSSIRSMYSMGETIRTIAKCCTIGYFSTIDRGV